MENWNQFSAQKNNRVLVIDDNPAIHEDFRKILGGKGKETSGLDQTEAVFFDEESSAAGAAGAAEEHFEIDSAYQGKEGLEKVEQALKEGRPYAMAFVD